MAGPALEGDGTQKRRARDGNRSSKTNAPTVTLTENAGVELVKTPLHDDLVDTLVRDAMNLGYTAAADFAEQMAFKLGEENVEQGAILWMLAKAMRERLVVRQGSAIGKKSF